MRSSSASISWRNSIFSNSVRALLRSISSNWKTKVKFLNTTVTPKTRTFSRLSAPNKTQFFFSFFFFEYYFFKRKSLMIWTFQRLSVFVFQKGVMVSRTKKCLVRTFVFESFMLSTRKQAISGCEWSMGSILKPALQWSSCCQHFRIAHSLSPALQQENGESIHSGESFQTLRVWQTRSSGKRLISVDGRRKRLK